MKRWTLPIALAAVIGLCGLPLLRSDAMIPNGVTILDGVDADFSLHFTDPTTKRDVTPAVVQIAVDRVSAQAGNSSVLLALTTLASPAALMTFTLPSRVHPMATGVRTPELQDLSVLWQWYPGTCSTHFLTSCASDDDCTDETCIPHHGKQVLEFTAVRSLH